MAIRREVYVPIVITLITATVLYFGSPSPWITGVFLVFLAVSLLFYFVIYPEDAIPDLRLAQWYFVALAVQCLHFVEEYVGAIYIKLPALLEIPPISKDGFVVFNLVAYAIFILGGIALIKHLRSFMIIPIFFILLGVFANGIIHVLLTLWNGSYFPGLYTAIAYLFLGPFLLRQIIRKPQEIS